MILAVCLMFLAVPFIGCLGTSNSQQKVNNTQPTVINYYNNTTTTTSPADTQNKDQSPQVIVQQPAPQPISNPPVQCQKPWPSRIDLMTSNPSSLTTGQTYTFQCQMYVQNYDTHCTLSPWWYAVDTPITWTFTNTNTGIVITKESKTSNPDGIATVKFPAYMAGHWTYTARWAGNSNYIETEKSGSFDATGSKVYWNGYWIQAQSAYYARNYPFYYPNTYYWSCYQRYDYVFIELSVSNALSGINQQSLYNLYVTTSTGTYSGYEISTYNGGPYSVGMPPGGSNYVWMCFQIPHYATINGLYGQVTQWNTADAYLGPTSYTVQVPLPSMGIH